MSDETASVDDYLEALPAEDRAALARLRKVIRSAAPGAEETISYQMPTFKYHGPLVAFAAFKDHLSFFVMSTSVANAYRDQLEGYDTSKGTIRFQPDEPLPASLVKGLVKARIEENMKSEGKAGRRTHARRPRHPMPDYLKRALEDRGLTGAYDERPPYQRNDYVGWITRARQEATRQRRLDQMLDELERGDAYMNMPYKPATRRRKA